ncbi:hypothetical protein ABT154_19985 [Streptomyces sp. NPDC001728]|uniref:hypothetical protein n=1 Tax=Streptomyces sp. NPDC001728 TaxID=3154396 RepID=UPI00332AAA5E
MTIQQPLSFSDLYAVNSSADAVRAAFTKRFQKKPDGICVNKETYFDAVTPAITEQYGHPCFKRVGAIVYTEGSPSSPRDVVVASHFAMNKGDETATIGVSIEGGWTESTTATVTVTTGITVTTEFELTGAWKMGGSFALTVASGKSTSATANRSAQMTAEVEVPPHSKRKVEMVAVMQEEAVDFRAPVTVDGMFGANFPDRVEEHYFWFLPASDVLPSTSGSLQGSVKRAFAVNTQTTVHPAEPI